MSTIVKKHVAAPDETMGTELGVAEIFKFELGPVYRLVLQPGWRYSVEGPALGYPPSCPAMHFAYQVSGVVAFKMDSGEEFEVGPGDIFSVPEGHDAWVVGDEPVVMLDWAETVHPA
jgi:hypothetical protein